MSAPLIGVLALQGDVREHIRSLELSGARAVAVGSVDVLDTVDALVIPGGESTTMSKLAIMDGLLEPLRAARAGGLPMYGSCAGMIMLADRVTDARHDQETIGGLDVTVRRNAFGRQVDSFEANVRIPAIGGEPFPAVFIRAPRVDEIGSDVEVLATVDRGDGDGTIVAVRQGRLLATAFHPELTGDLRIHEYFVEMVRNP
ncbi:MAG: pyridoxal 5'-phosphate synthase glutaminase subunit PdxT [Actinomycetes bacterium]